LGYHFFEGLFLRFAITLVTSFVYTESLLLELALSDRILYYRFCFYAYLTGDLTLSVYLVGI